MSKIIIVSGPVIVEDSKTLLDIQGGDNFWKFCGGKTRNDENLKQTAIRRAKEELGIDVEILNEQPFLMYVNKQIDGENKDILLVHWLAKRIGEPKAGEGVRETGWIDINNLPEDVGPNVGSALKHFGFTE